ncbi:hypothetical protein [Hahella chejuensis]|uniref:hypothetical protein n=1 Tax=Hahella chejuensis TaxID=158327 RepID=UPI000304D403|nr:hypothetical protein [Hahella chejuensis]
MLKEMKAVNIAVATMTGKDGLANMNKPDINQTFLTIFFFHLYSPVVRRRLGCLLASSSVMTAPGW